MITRQVSLKQRVKVASMVFATLILGVAAWSLVSESKRGQIVCPPVLTTSALSQSISPSSDDTIAQLAVLTRNLLQRAKHYRSIPWSGSRSGEELRQEAVTRKQLLLKALARNPEQLSPVLLPENERKLVSDVSQGCVEQAVRLSGQAIVGHTEFLDGTGRKEYGLDVGNGKVHRFFFVSGEAEVLPRSMVSVSGLGLDDAVMVSSFSTETEDVTTGVTPRKIPDDQEGGASTQRTLVLMLYSSIFSRPTSPTFAEVQNFVFGDSNSARSFHRENSNSTVNLTGEVRSDWTEVPFGMCSFWDIQSSVIPYFDATVDYLQFDRVTVVNGSGFEEACGGSGSGSIGSYEMLTNDGLVSLSLSIVNPNGVPPQNTPLHVLSHEIGHNLGWAHAEFLPCETHEVVFGQDCITVEYGHPFDVMSNIQLGHSNAGMKDQLHFLTASMIQEIDPQSLPIGPSGRAEGTFVIEPLELQSNGLKVLKVRRGITPDYFHVEFRRPIGYDARFNNEGDLFAGASITIDGGLIDAFVPPGEQASNLNSSLPVGARLNDVVSGVGIEAVSLDNANNPETARLTVRVLSGRTDTIPPTVNITEPVENQAISGTALIRASATDEQTGIDHVEFSVKHACLESSPQLLSSTSNPPYETTWDTNSFTYGSYSIYANAFDRSGVPFGVSGNNALDTVWVNVNNGPTSIQLVTPQPGDTLRGSTTLQSTVQRLQNPSVYYFYKQGSEAPQAIGSSATSPYSVIWDTTRIPDGSYIVYAIAFGCSAGVARSPDTQITIRNTGIVKPPARRLPIFITE